MVGEEIGQGGRTRYQRAEDRLPFERVIFANCTIGLSLVCAAEEIGGQLRGLRFAEFVVRCDERGCARAVAVVGEIPFGGE